MTTANESVTALILAGTRPGGDPLALAEGVSHKALLDVGGRTVLDRVIDAVRGAGLERIVVLADDPAVVAIAEAMGAECMVPATGPSQSVYNALEAFGAPMLVTTSDHALLRPDWIRQCIDDTPEAADLGVMLAPRRAVEEALPGNKRTYLKLGDGEWSGCNLFYLKTPRSREAIRLWMRIEQDRKKPWRMVAKIGPGMLLAYLFGRLSMADAIRRIGQRIGIRSELVAARDGLAAVDVDKPQDLELVRALVAQGR